MLCDRGRPADHLAAEVILYQRPHQRKRVEPGMVVILLIFHSDGSSYHVGRDLVEGHVSAPSGIRVDHFVQQVAIAVIETGGFKLGRVRFDVVDAGQCGRDGKVLVHQERRTKYKQQHKCKQSNDDSFDQATPPAFFATRAFPRLVAA